MESNEKINKPKERDRERLIERGWTNCWKGKGLGDLVKKVKGFWKKLLDTDDSMETIRREGSGRR